MSEPPNHASKSLRERLALGTEDRLGKALADLIDSPLLSGSLGKALDSRERMAQAQELAMGVLNLPSAADIERLTRRLRSVSQRLEGIEDGVQRLDRATVSRLSSIEDQLNRLADKLESSVEEEAAAPAKSKPAKRAPAQAKATQAKPKQAKPKRAGAAPKPARRTPAKPTTRPAQGEPPAS